jgi:hypothetical protein
MSNILGVVWGLLKPRVSCQERNPILEGIYCRYDIPMKTLRKIQRGGAPWKYLKVFIIGWSITSFIQKKGTLKTYQSILSNLTVQFGERDLNSLTPEEVLSFLTDFNQGTNQLTKRTRYSQLISFFNFVTQNLDPDFRSPCDTPMLKKLYRPPGGGEKFKTSPISQTKSNNFTFES